MAMNSSQAQIVDLVLTNVARGYTNAGFVGSYLFPQVTVEQRAGKVVQFGKEHFRRYNTRRAPGAAVATVEFGYAGRPYALNQHALKGKVPIELLQDAQAVPGINMGTQAVNAVLAITRLELECQQAEQALNAANYASSNKLTLSGTSQWSHDSAKPGKAVRAAAQVIRSKIGRMPNVLILGAMTWDAVQENPSVIDRVKYVGSDSLTTDIFAKLCGVEKVVVGEAVYADETDTFVDVWGKHAVLAYAAPVSLAAQGSPSFAYTYQLSGHPFVEQTYYDNDTKSWLYPVTDEHSAEIVGADAGFLFTNAVA
jgi:hypothetical protein